MTLHVEQARALNERPNCWNRRPYSDTVIVQDGWAEWCDIDTRERRRAPVMIEIPNAMSRECKQHGEFGAATTYRWDCRGCRWAPAGICDAEADHAALMAKVQESWARRWAVAPVVNWPEPKPLAPRRSSPEHNGSHFVIGADGRIGL